MFPAKTIRLFAAISAAMALGACGYPAEEEASQEELETQSHCIANQKARVAAWRAAGVPAAEIERRRKLAVSACADSTVDHATAVYLGAVNIDLERLARMVTARALTPRQYILRMRDRTRKARLARHDPVVTGEWLSADADADLVPDRRDRCPGTKELEPTGDDGCPQAEEKLGHVPDEDALHQVLDKLGVMRSPACDGAPRPARPSPLAMRYDCQLWSLCALEIDVTRAQNQPANCPVFYEIDAVEDGRITSGWPRVSRPERLAQRVVFRESEAVANNGDTLTFRILPLAPARQEELRNFACWKSRWRVQAVNGNGAASGWSAHLENIWGP